jgi:DNA-directed RNA polymerase specialized sigma24 family protein
MAMADLETDRILLALLALAVDEREAAMRDAQGGRARTEVVLHGAGLDNTTIAELLNKPAKSVGQTIRRASGGREQD